MDSKKKHSFEFKLRCVKQMDEHYLSAKSLGKEYGITYSLLETWYRIYKYYGAPGLLPKKGKRIFSAAFKLEVLKTIREENLSLKEARVRFDLSSDAHIIEWRKRLERFGAIGLEARPKGRLPMTKKESPQIKRKPKKTDKIPTREEELLQENEYLRAENALLKKLQALAHEESKRKP